MTAKECDKLIQLTEITDLKKYWEHEALDFTPPGLPRRKILSYCQKLQTLILR